MSYMKDKETIIALLEAMIERAKKWVRVQFVWLSLFLFVHAFINKCREKRSLWVTFLADVVQVETFINPFVDKTQHLEG